MSGITKVRKVKCINNINVAKVQYDITVGKEYEVLGQKESFYVLKNDSDLEVGYALKYFEDITVNLSDREIVESIYLSGTTFYIHNKENKKMKLWEYSYWGTDSFGCGNKLVFQIEHLINGCREVSKNPKFSLDIFETVLNRLKERMAEKTGLLLLSTFTNRGAKFNFPFIEKIEEMSSASAEGFNPNSENDVAIWIFVLREPKNRKSMSVG
tara:strand:- start:1082 stop:1717 length:636 start_codon:yes stop_codon:yes gene_type:complete